MEQPGGEPIYVINESVRQAVLAIITRAVHPRVPFDQVDAIRIHLANLRPVQVMEGVVPTPGASTPIIDPLPEAPPEEPPEEPTEG